MPVIFSPWNFISILIRKLLVCFKVLVSLNSSACIIFTFSFWKFWYSLLLPYHGTQLSCLCNIKMILCQSRTCSLHFWKSQLRLLRIGKIPVFQTVGNLVCIFCCLAAWSSYFCCLVTWPSYFGCLLTWPSYFWITCIFLLENLHSMTTWFCWGLYS